MCTIAIKLKNISIAPLLDGGFWCFEGTKITIQLFSSTVVNALIDGSIIDTHWDISY